MNIQEVINYLKDLGCPSHLLEQWETAAKEGKELKVSDNKPEVGIYLKFNNTYYHI